MRFYLKFKRRLRRRLNRDPYHLNLVHDYHRSISFCIFCMIVFYGFSAFVLAFNYMSMTPVRHEEDWFAGKAYFDQYLDRPFDSSFDLSDGRISNIENILIFVFMLWGWMRTFDLLRYIKAERVVNRWRWFWELSE